jgi:hypothetical protein
MIYVCPAAIRDQVDELMLPINRGPAFTSPLAPEGATEPTHYWCSARVTDEEGARMEAILGPEILAQLGIFADTDPDDVLAQLSLVRFVTNEQ